MKNLILVLGLNIFLSFTGVATDNGSSSISGKITDANGRVVSNASVTIKYNDEIFKGNSDSEGIFHMKLPNGTYNIEVWKQGFYENRRSKFLLKENVNLIFNFTLMFYELTEFRETNISKQSSRMCYCSDLILNDIIAVQRSKEKINDILIQHAGKTESPDNIQFNKIGILFEDCERIESELNKVNPRNDKYFQVITTYDTKTIYSDTVTVDKTKNVLLATGNVSFEENGVKIPKKQVLINLSGGSVVEQ